jgi:hypothetical protein
MVTSVIHEAKMANKTIYTTLFDGRLRWSDGRHDRLHRMKVLLFVLLGLVSVAPIAAPAPEQPVPFCTPDNDDPALICTCLAQHEGWCEDEAAPVPPCCKAMEKGGKAKRCHCCAGGGERRPDPQHQMTHQNYIQRYRATH